MSPVRARRVAALMATALVVAAPELDAATVGRTMEPEEPLRVSKVHPPAPPTGREVELTIYGQGFSSDESKLRVVLTTGNQTVRATQVRFLSTRRLRASFPAQQHVGPRSVTVSNSPAGPSSTLHDALYVRAGDRRWAWRAMLFRVRYDWRGFVEWFEFGGLLMYVLGLLSFFGVAFAFHCLLVLRRSQVLPQRLLEALISLLGQGDLRGAAATCEKSQSVFGRVVLSGLRNADEPADKVRDSIEAAGSRESAHLHQKISYLANIGVISPMVGLLGTVLGMIESFNVISSGEVRHYMLAAAIAKAMVTTAAGLLIGIPAMAVYFYLRGRLLRVMTDLEVAADTVAQSIVETGGEL